MSKEIISTFKELPKTKVAWWAFGSGLSLILLLIINMVSKIDISWGNLNVMPALLIPLLILAITTCTMAYRKGERSYIVWIGIAPTILFTLLMIMEITGLME